MKEYFDGEERQRAVSFWSIGSWGGMGMTSFVGGAIATYMGWRWIFIFSIILAFIAMILIKEVPESKAKEEGKFTFDYLGLLLFILSMIGLNVYITQGSLIGWFSPLAISLLIIFIVGTALFIRYE